MDNLVLISHLVMARERKAQELREEIEAFLIPLSNAADLYNLSKEPLGKTGRALAIGTHSSQPWPLLPVMVCEAISGRYEQALPAAAALQLLISAGDVFDDIEDADSPESLSAKYGPAIATNVATTLLILAERGITRLKIKGVEDCMIVQVMDAVNSYYTTACIGQHLDLSLSSKMDVPEDIYIKIASMKSASQIECACHIGALLATADQELVKTLALFGHNLGMAAQITNDILGVTSGSDILKPKISLPTVYALAQAEGEAYSQLAAAFGERSKAIFVCQQIRDLIFGTGAIHYATIKMEYYKQRAYDNLLNAQRSGASIEQLESFLK